MEMWYRSFALHLRVKKRSTVQLAIVEKNIFWRIVGHAFLLIA